MVGSQEPSMSATLNGILWEYNMAKVVLVDVTDDYRTTRGPLPAECYPVLKEIWVPIVAMPQGLTDPALLGGYTYDWHQSPREDVGPWYVGVVARDALEGSRDPAPSGAR
jgi:hypothetical protein